MSSAQLQYMYPQITYTCACACSSFYKVTLSKHWVSQNNYNLQIWKEMLLLFCLIASKYKDSPNSRAIKSSQNRSGRPGTSWYLQGTPESNTFASQGKGRGQTQQTSARKSPGKKGRFISTAERVTTHNFNKCTFFLEQWNTLLRRAGSTLWK